MDDTRLKICDKEKKLEILYRRLANCIRVLSMDAVEQAQSGHAGMPLGMADVVTVLFKEFLHFMPNDARWFNRDRFVLSAGHGSMLLYSILYLTGYPDISLEDIKNFRQLHSKAAGHPEYGLLDGIETTTGPLGQGLSNAVGMEIARNINAKKLKASEILDHKIYVVVGDGCLMEGISHETCSLAGHLKLSNLIVLYDSNDITIDGKRSISDSDNVEMRFRSYGWQVQTINGHDFSQIRNALSITNTNNGPSLIICNTKIGYGTPTKEGHPSSHGTPFGVEEVRQAKLNYGWSEDKPFFIPEDLLRIWRQVYKKSQYKYENWQKQIGKLSYEQKKFLNQIGHYQVSKENCNEKIVILKETFLNLNSQISTRKASGEILALLSKDISFVGGSADLTGSNNTKPEHMYAVSHDNWQASYIHYGVREHAMGGIMNGIALYGGMIPYGGSFLVFMDYAKPALRMAALMKLQVIYVMTHDSIGVGEDGATHQPIEQLSYLRATPNVHVFRPADSIETSECWELALQIKTGPSVLCLTRQSVPTIRQKANKENLCKRGAYIISEYEGTHKVTIFATGSEVSIALEAQKLLQKENIGTRVISVPCVELLEQQEESYKKQLLDNKTIKVAVEAATRLGWDRYIGKDGIFIGMSNFGASAPYKDLYKYFCITAKEVLSSIFKQIE